MMKICERKANIFLRKSKCIFFSKCSPIECLPLSSFISENRVYLQSTVYFNCVKKDSLITFSQYIYSLYDVMIWLDTCLPVSKIVTKNIEKQPRYNSLIVVVTGNCYLNI